jgi:hypothetical protein
MEFSVKINNSSHPVTFGPTNSYFFGKVHQFGLKGVCEDITTLFPCSAILVMGNKEYFISKNPFEIQDMEGKGIDVSNNGMLLPFLPEEARFFALVTLIDKTVNQNTTNLDVNWFTFQSCSDCWADSYCAWNCSYKPVCSWSTGCHARTVEQEVSTAGEVAPAVNDTAH